MSPTPRTGSVGDARAFVEEYVAAATAADHAPYLALFDDNAVVRDEGRTHRGRTEVRRWRDRVPPVEYDVREVTGTAAACRAVAEVSGAFPGSPVTLHFAFERDARGRITRLEITPTPA